MLPTSSQPRESASGARQTCSAALCVRILVFAQVFVCQTFAPCCRPDAPFPSCERGFMTMRKSLFRIFVPPFPWRHTAFPGTHKASYVSPYARRQVSGDVFRLPERLFRVFRFSLSRFPFVKIFYRRLTYIYAFMRFSSHVFRHSPSVLRRGGDEKGCSVAM